MADIRSCNQSGAIGNREAPGLIHSTVNQDDLAMEKQNQYIIDQHAELNIVEVCTKWGLDERPFKVNTVDFIVGSRRYMRMTTEFMLQVKMSSKQFPK